MNDAIIGGAIAAVIGAVVYAIVGLFQERRREKAQQLAIVDALIVETLENLAICETYLGQETWWLAPYKLDTYHTCKGQIFFLPADTINRLVGIALVMDSCNHLIQTVQLKEGSGQSIDKKSMPRQEQLIEQLKLVYEGLQNWGEKHGRCRLFNLAYAVYHRLRDFPSKIRIIRN